MSFSPIPKYSFPSLRGITPDFLKGHGIRLLLLDLDNTMAPYGTELPPESIAIWARDIKKSGIDLFIITNNNGSKRVESLAEAFDVGYIMSAKKPFATGIKRALKQLGRQPSETALAGDQIYTDVIAANSAGVLSIVVEPLKLRNPLLNLRYWLEAPFRALCRNKMR
ncbi:MAG: YqeG family HAD IIIA-type phosphatase [Clostridiales bacterium]|nr:YqeG family HAD IIIA-type phosphatase [Clostridiales bacterium]